MALNLWFSALYTYWDAILAGSGWLLASKAYIHNWPWVLGPDLPQKHLLTTSGSLKKALNSTQITLKLIFKPTRMLFWVALYGNLVLGPDLPLKHLFTTSGSLKKALNTSQINPNQDLHPLGCILGGSGWFLKPISIVDILGCKILVGICLKYIFFLCTLDFVSRCTPKTNLSDIWSWAQYGQNSFQSQ